MDDDASFGHWLIKRRKALGLSRVELARRVSCATITLRKIEEDARRPSVELASLLAEHLAVTPAERLIFVSIARRELRVDRLAPANQPILAAQRPMSSVLPIPLTPLVGREHELTELRTLLTTPTCRLITILGPGGIGKTGLALALAADQAKAFADGAIFVPLAPIESAALIAPAILAAVGVGLQGQRDPREQLLAVLRGKELLLVLDNFEQLLSSGTDRDDHITTVLTDLLRQAQRVTLLVTSRERLGIPGEWLYDLAGLSYPIGAPDEHLERFSAVQLFVQRAQQVWRQFVLTDSEAPVVARICRQVEGLPLAIELAAAGVRSRSCMQIEAAIATSMIALATEFGAVPKRHRSVWAAFEHSWQLLNGEERAVFAQLSVFRGGFAEQAAASIASAPPELLAALVDKSLLRWDGARYNLHELLRQYADGKLAQTAERNVLRRKHTMYYLNVAQALQTSARGRHTAGLDVLEQEHDNLRAALAWTLECEELSTGVQLAQALANFWEVRGYWRDGLTWTESLLAQSRGKLASTAVIDLLRQVAHMARRQGDYRKAMVFCEEELRLCRERDDSLGTATALRSLGQLAWAEEEQVQAVAYYEKGLALCRELDDQLGMVDALCRLGQLAQAQGDGTSATQWFEECLRHCRNLNSCDTAASLQMLAGALHRDYVQALALLDESLALFYEVDDREGIADSLRYLGELAFEHGDCQRAAARYTESLALYYSSGDWHGIAMILLDQGEIAYVRGDDDQAVFLFAESLQRHQELGNMWGIATALHRLGRTALRRSDSTRAMRYARESIQLFGELKHIEGIASCLSILAGAAAQQGQTERAAHLLSAATMLIPDARILSSVDRIEVERTIALVHTQLDSATFDAAWAMGKAMTMNEALAKALEAERSIASLN
jgi:predicted ATPase/transcriptional regulator with XRE-family HTH domain